MPVELIMGPPISGPNGMSRTAAETALLNNPAFPKNVEYTLSALNGHWVAGISTKQAAPFPPGGDEEESGPPKSEGPPSDSGPSDDGGSSDSEGPPSDGGDSEAPPHKEKSEGGEKSGLHELNMKIDMLMQALGIDPMGGAGGDPSMVPGPDDGMGGPPGGPGGPPGAGLPGMGGPAHGGPPAPDKTVHERALKPGEVPPGGTPLGAPAFANVQAEHPWGHTIGVVPHFRVAEDIGDQDIVEVEAELQSLASAGGFKVSNFTPMHDEDGKRYVSAVISTPKSQ